MTLKIDFIAPPFSGHLNPLIELAQPWLKRPASIRFITGPNKLPLLQRLGFQALPLLEHTPNAMERIANTAMPVGNNPIKLLQQLRQNLALLPFLKQELKTYWTRQKPDIVVADFVAVPAGMVCRELGIPWITTMPTPFALETRNGTPSYLGGWSPNTFVGSQLRDWLGRKIIRSFKYTVGRLCKPELDALGFRIYRSDGSENAYSPHAIVGLGMPEFEFARDWPKHFHWIGPCCASPEPAVPLTHFTRHGVPSILVTLGTHLDWAKPRLLADLQKLAAHFPLHDFVVSLGQPSAASHRVLQTHANIRVYAYVPYSQTPDQFQAVIHHGGAGITYHCIRHAKACLVLPHDYDQFDFAARIVAARIGLKIKSLQAASTVIKLSRILSPDFFPGLQRLQEYSKHYHPAENLKNIILKVIGTKETVE